MLKPSDEDWQRFIDGRAVLALLVSLGIITLLLLLFRTLFHSVGLAAWVYLAVALLSTLRWGRTIGVVAVALVAVLLLSLPIAPGWNVSSSNAADLLRLGISLAGMLLAVLLVDVANQGRIAAERQLAIRAEQDRLYEAERKARQEAEAAVRMRDQFLSAISHDLQTPLTIIKGQSQYFQRVLQHGREVGPEIFAEGLATIDSAATKMSSMIADLLDLARLQIGKSPDLQLEPCDLVSLVKQFCSLYRQECAEHRLVIETAAPTLVGAWDVRRLERVLVNLVSNALKYSPTGGRVTIRVSRDEPQHGAPAWAVVSVTDQGVGIPEADLPTLFEPFHRGSNVVGRIDGTGIGLAGARQSVEQHGGSIAVSSLEGAGATFTIRLPLTQAGSPESGAS
ncbi:MAG: sensor histidine kinase [Dehalococcoidia bacterium]